MGKSSIWDTWLQKLSSSSISSNWMSEVSEPPGAILGTRYAIPKDSASDLGKDRLKTSDGTIE